MVIYLDTKAQGISNSDHLKFSARFSLVGLERVNSAGAH